MKSLIVYSGGMDSSVLLYEFRDSIALALSFNYGAKHNNAEIVCAKKMCKKLKIKHIVLNLKFINKYYKSNLLRSGGEIPTGNYDTEKIKKTVIPFRNGIMLSIATGLAESNELSSVLIANHFGDHAIYPDCRENFIVPFSIAAKNGTYNGVEILSPYCKKNKSEIASIGKKLGVDFSKTYSCYNGKKKHCGVCATCLERKEALAGFDNTCYICE